MTAHGIRWLRRLRVGLLPTLTCFTLLSALRCAASGADVDTDSSTAGQPDSGGIQEDVYRDPYANDPPPEGCPWVDPGGTAPCPDDKNLQGCPCPEEGMTAPCWPGFRRHRSSGVCKDGVATCQPESGELKALRWSACEGFEGIDPVTFLPPGETGAAACECFADGEWKIDNLVTCYYTTADGAVIYSSAMGATEPCQFQSDPPAPWSANTLSAGCGGNFTLCYTLHAFSAPGANPAPDDCVIQKVCTQGQYSGGGEPLAMPHLPGWSTSTPAEEACAGSYVTNGGYARLSVSGETQVCEPIDSEFQWFKYCPLDCTGPNDPKPKCANCSTSGGGTFGG